MFTTWTTARTRGCSESIQNAGIATVFVILALGLLASFAVMWGQTSEVYAARHVALKMWLWISVSAVVISLLTCACNCFNIIYGRVPLSVEMWLDTAHYFLAGSTLSMFAAIICMARGAMLLDIPGVGVVTSWILSLGTWMGIPGLALFFAGAHSQDETEADRDSDSGPETPLEILGSFIQLASLIVGGVVAAIGVVLIITGFICSLVGSGVVPVSFQSLYHVNCGLAMLSPIIAIVAALAFWVAYLLSLPVKMLDVEDD